jgi:hypothetical protein
MTECETQIDRLRDELESDIWTFRWLWLINLAALVWGLATGNWALLCFAAVSALVAIIGVGRTRRGRKLVDRVENTCLPPKTSSDR